MTSLHRTLLAATAAVALGSGALAQQQGEFVPTFVSASDILDGKVSNGLNTVATVNQLVLDDESAMIEYVVVDSNSPLWQLERGDRYLPIDGVNFERGPDRANLQIYPDNAAPVSGPDRFAVTANDASHRLVDQVLGGQLTFTDRQDLRINDLLLDPQTGEVTHFVVRVKDNPFSWRLLALPARHVQPMAQGFAADLSLAEVKSAPTRDIEIL
jgi:hypothetical protein